MPLLSVETAADAMNRRSFVALAVASIVGASAVGACTAGTESSPSAPSGGYRVVATTGVFADIAHMALGETINLMTLGGLAIAIGEVADGSLVNMTAIRHEGYECCGGGNIVANTETFLPALEERFGGANRTLRPTQEQDSRMTHEQLPR